MQVRSASRFLSLSSLLAVVTVSFAIAPCQAADTKEPTVMPVEFLSTINAGRAKPGDSFKAKILQPVFLTPTKTLPKGTLLLGHVVSANASRPVRSLADQQASSSLSIRFDAIEKEGTRIPLHARLRALASSTSSEEARTPRMDGQDFFTTVKQVGGDQYSVSDRPVFSPFGKLVGYRNKQGIYARLEPGKYVTEYSTFLCAGTGEAESVALFSASACGLYGFDTSTYLVQDGSTDSGNITIESQLYTVELHAGTTALLEWGGL